MGKKKTTEEFINDAIKIHGNNYDYSLVEYINSQTKIKIICSKHGIFEQTPNNHLNGQNCFKCNGNEKKTNADFINDSIKVHGSKYEYSLVEYRGNKTKVKIMCKKHGIFEQEPSSHLSGKGCSECRKDILNLKFKLNTNEFIKRAIKAHGNKYNYSLVNYINVDTKVEIICSEHGIFEQTPYNHYNGSICPKCNVKQRGINKRKDLYYFINKANDVHYNKYDYSKVVYKTTTTPIIIICPTHGMFLQNPSNHLYNASGCPNCKSSKGELTILNILNNKNIKYEREKKFELCVYKRKLPFDFYLYEHNICIEYDGVQHFKEINKWVSEKSSLKHQQLKDNIKTEYCKNNNIVLLRIRYDENIEEKLTSFLKEKGII